MSEKKAASINIKKAILDIPLTVLAAIGSATGNIWIAGLTALPGVSLNAFEALKPLLAKQELLQLPAPPWLTESSQSWQEICSSIEYHLPSIMDGVAERLRKEQKVPAPALVQRAFKEEINNCLSEWGTRTQDRNLIAGYVTPLLLERFAVEYKALLAAVREEALAELLTKVAGALDEAQQMGTAPILIPSPSGTGVVSPGTQQGAKAIPDSQSLNEILLQKMLDESYDVYICYNEADETEVFKISKQLKTYGILPWLDDIRPGMSVREQQEQQIENIPAAAVFAGKHAIAGWQALQMYSFIDQFVQRSCPVIPVLLSDAPQKPKLPPYLSNFQWVDFRRQEPDPMDQLLFGITGKHRPIK